MVADTSFANRYSERVVQFFDNVNVGDEALESLMEPFRPNSDVTDQMGAAREWIRNHRQLVARWVPPSDSVQEDGGAAQGSAQTAAR
ncbi:MAG: hypothetical protein BRD52_02250 [Bacteroidetes bacterium SW_4_67_19]|nr:MAG: hypothetical protein BRD52_02250 [Bacteroidetes bacterium SW_4_67_19]